jgi:predicted PhzF superfamily epimerase YddE/YHI9
MSEVVVEVVRVFTDERGRFGNELGIVESSAASEGREQAIAAELGFSETVFIDSLDDARATIRIFTPTTEMRFAGHPSVGTAWWLAQRGTPIDTLVEKAGDVPVRYDGDLTWISGRAQWASQFEWMPLATPADVDALNPDAFTGGHNYAYAWIDKGAGVLRSRMFAPPLGIREDEATGAAAVAITTHLNRDLEIIQGGGSRISTIRGADGTVAVGGRTAPEQQITLH